GAVGVHRDRAEVPDVPGGEVAGSGRRRGAREGRGQREGRGRERGGDPPHPARFPSLPRPSFLPEMPGSEWFRGWSAQRVESHERNSDARPSPPRGGGFGSSHELRFFWLSRTIHS